MNTLISLFVLFVGALLSGVTSAESNCGVLEERLLFSTDTSTEPAEYPWVGILFQSKGKIFENTRCNVIIVGEYHVLTLASCVRRFNDRPETATVRLGIWNETHSPDQEYVCNTKGFCVPGPVEHAVAEIKVHPQADKDTGDNDLAILRLSQRIKWTNYIRPLCVQPIAEPASWINRNFHYSGFEHSGYLKGKGQALAISRPYCNELRKTSKATPENQFCGYPIKRTKFYEGSAFVALNIERDVPRNFYLVGLLVKVINVGQTTVFVIQDVRPWRSWLLENTQ